MGAKTAEHERETAEKSPAHEAAPEQKSPPPSALHHVTKHVTRKRVILAAKLIVVAVVLFFVWLNVHFMIGDDLVIRLAANQTSFRITNQENATVDARLSASKQLFCSTDCELELVDPDGLSQHNESFVVRADQTVSRDFKLSPKGKGTGQVVYSLSATCANRKSLLCPSAGVKQRDTVLLTVNYGLTQDVDAARSRLAAELPQRLALLRDADIALLSAKTMLMSSPRLHPGQLLADLAGAQTRFAASLVALENARAQWSQEDYPQALASMEETGADASGLATLASDAMALRDSVLALPAEHNSLRSQLSDARAGVAASLSAHASLSGDSVARPVMRALAQRTDAAVALYADENYLRYSDLRQRADDIVNATIVADATLVQRENAVLILGDSLLSARKAAMCALNLTPAWSCDNMSLPPSSIVAACAELAQAASVSDNATLLFNATYCAPSAILLDMSPLSPVDALVLPNVTSAVNTTLPIVMPQCCVFGQCAPCCSDTSCADNPSTYPIVFVHGHAFNGGNTPEYSLGAYFNDIQQELQRDGYIDAGIVTPSSTLSEVAQGEWGLSGKPVMARITYYYNFYRNGNDYVLIAQKSENIETYALRLNEMINLIKHHTGKKKVNIVAHSMGGLVVRRYLQLFGEDSVDKVVLIGTPDHGTVGRTKTLCALLGEAKECTDMEADSVFMRKLNDPTLQPKSVKFTTIAGVGCTVDGKDADGVATSESVALDFATNYQENGTCSDLFGAGLHTGLLDVKEHPRVYALIKDALR